jgi:Lon protease-like protein
MKLNFPKQIPVFPLSGVIYFPKTNLPLNIFEKRYLDLVNDCVKKDNLMGMVQSKKNGSEVYKVGCLGKIGDFKKTKDGRVTLNLTGITRFQIIKEINNDKLYREFIVEYSKFEEDLIKEKNEKDEDPELLNLFEKTKNFFDKNGLLLNWLEFGKLDQEQQINTLSMIAPISNVEKQKLLETVKRKEKINIFSDIIDFYHHENNLFKSTIQ